MTWDTLSGAGKGKTRWWLRNTAGLACGSQCDGAFHIRVFPTWAPCAISCHKGSVAGKTDSFQVPLDPSERTLGIWIQCPHADAAWKGENPYPEHPSWISFNAATHARRILPLSPSRFWLPDVSQGFRWPWGLGLGPRKHHCGQSRPQGDGPDNLTIEAQMSVSKTREISV